VASVAKVSRCWDKKTTLQASKRARLISVLGLLWTFYDQAEQCLWCRL